MLGLGIPIIYRSFNTGDSVVAPIFLYASDFTSDTDGWFDPDGIGDLSAPQSTAGGLDDTLRYVSLAPFQINRRIRLNLSSLPIPSGNKTYVVKFTFEGTASSSTHKIKASASLGSNNGPFTGLIPKDTPATYHETFQSTSPNTFDINFESEFGVYTDVAYFKNIELYYYP